MSYFAIYVVQPGGALVQLESEEFGPNDSLETLMIMISRETGVPVHLQKLLADDRLIPVNNLDATLGSLKIENGMTLTLISMSLPRGLKLHFPLDSSSLAKEVVADVDHAFLQEHVEVVDDAVHFTGQQRLLLNEPVEVHHAWTIMVWFRAPLLESEGEGFQNVCANARRNGGHIILQTGQLGVWISVRGGTSFCNPRFNLHTRFAGKPGWHHLVGVGASGSTTFYVDTEAVGVASVQNVEELGVIGHMYPGGTLQEAWVGPLRDFMLFDRALSPDEITSVFTSLGGALPAIDELNSQRDTSPIGHIKGLKLHFPLNPSEPCEECVRHEIHSFSLPDQVSIMQGAVHFPGQQRLLLNEPVEVGITWTIMAWFRTPMPSLPFQNLCANADRNGGHVILQGGKLGVWVSGGGGTVFCNPRYDLHALAGKPGWHHLAGVGADGHTTFYVDAEVVGVASEQNVDELGVIGHMYPRGQLQEAWDGALRDFMLFGRALPREEVMSVFTSTRSAEKIQPALGAANTSSCCHVL